MPFWLATLLVTAGVLAVLQGTNLAGDAQLADLASVAVVPLALLTIAVQFVGSRLRSRRSRLAALAITLAVPSLAAGLFRVDGVGPDLVPQVSFRGDPTPLEQTSTTRAHRSRRPERLISVYDFPQFLGPNRNLSVESVSLARDWQSYPPQLVWKHDIGPGWSGFVVGNGLAMTLEQFGDHELTTCYEVSTGILRWSHAFPVRNIAFASQSGPRGTPAISGGRVYALGVTGWLACLEGSSGEKIWEHDLRAMFDIGEQDEQAALRFGRGSSPLVVDGTVIIPVGGPSPSSRVSLAAFDARTGGLKWTAGDRNISYASPALAELAGNRHVVTVNSRTVCGHDIATGHVLWEFPLPEVWGDPNAHVTQAVPVGPNTILLSRGFFHGASLMQLIANEEGGLEPRKVWHNCRALNTKFNRVAVHDGRAYGLSAGFLECVELETGKRLWSGGRYGFGHLLRVNDLLLVQSEWGEVLLIDLTEQSTRRILGRFRAVRGTTWNSFALSGPNLLVRNAHEAACYRLPLELEGDGEGEVVDGR